MSKLSKFYKDKNVRKNFLRKEFKFLIYKYNLLDCKRKREKRFFMYKFINLFHLNWSRARIVNKCILTGRSRWVIGKYRLSRTTFKNMCDNGEIHGVRRSSW